MFDILKEKMASTKNAIVNFDYKKGFQSFFEKCRWFNIELTTAFDITTTIHWSVPLLILVLLLINPLQALIAMIALLSIIPHEYGHALAARWYGIKTSRILLYPLGGVALLIPRKDVKLEKVKELVVAAAGPAVSLALAAFGFFIMGPLPDFDGKPNISLLPFWFWVFAINMVVFLFNMIPAFPMDGGRMLRACIAFFTDHVRSTQYAYYCSVFMCALLGVSGLMIGNMTLPLTMIMIHMLARMEYIQAKKAADEEQGKNSEEKKENS